MIEIIWEVWSVKEIKNKLWLEKIEDFHNEKEILEKQKKFFLIQWKKNTKQKIIKLNKVIKENLIIINKLQNKNNNFIINIVNYLKIYSKRRKVNNIKKKIKYISQNIEYYSVQAVLKEIRDINKQLTVFNSLDKIYKWTLWELKIVKFLSTYK